MRTHICRASLAFCSFLDPGCEGTGATLVRACCLQAVRMIGLMWVATRYLHDFMRKVRLALVSTKRSFSQVQEKNSWLYVPGSSEGITFRKDIA